MRITIIGFGNQAKAWASNLQDSNIKVRVALRPDSHSIALAVKAGFEVVSTLDPSFYQEDAYALLTPDQGHHEFLQVHGYKFRADTLILYAHGYSLTKHHLEKTYPQLQHLLFAPKAIGSELRNQFVIKGKLGAVYSLEHVRNKSVVKDWLLTLAQGLGINLGPYETSFERETQADLFSEQGLLCSVIPYTAVEMFNQLTETGVEPELAYFECWHELKLIINAMVDKGPQGFFDLISPNALVGSEKGYQKLMTPEFKHNLGSLLKDIRSGEFDEDLDAADVAALRQTIRKRFAGSLVMTTFDKINRESK